MNKFLNFKRSLSFKGFATNGRSSRGFTLIELLIVIGIIGVLAAVILVAIDPVEQLKRARDAGRKSSVAQLGRALQAYYTVNSAYPVALGWDSALVTSGEIRIFPKDPSSPLAFTTVCTGGNVPSGNTYCYKVDASSPPNMVVYTHLESKSETNKGSCGGVVLNTWYVYSSIDGRSGIVCIVSPTEPVPAQIFVFY